MCIMNMHLIQVLCLILSLHGSALVESSPTESSPTFNHRDPRTGENLVCAKCPPGTHMSAYCTATTPTQCAQCKEHHFTELWNYLTRCLYCDNFCSENQEVVAECSRVSNTVCRCKENFYWANGFCVRHSECDVGHGVQKKGTAQTDTVCETCPDGFFSNSSSAHETCAKHQECANGETVLLPGSIYQDTICGSCEHLAKRGEMYRASLLEHLSIHRIRVVKLKRFVTKNIDKPAQMHRGPLLHQIRGWLAQAPDEQLKKLPQMLRASHLNNVADKLEFRFLELQEENPGCNSDL